MSKSNRRNVLIVLVIVLIVVLLLLARCLPEKPKAPQAGSAPTPSVSAPPATPGAPAAAKPAADEAVEVLTPATLTLPARVAAGAAFGVAWTGPDNRGDYLTIVRRDDPADTLGNYRETREGKSLDLTAPIEPGPYEVRYVTSRTHTILGRAPVEVDPVGASLDAPAEVVLGAEFSVTWTGPNNKGDYVTIVPTDAPDDHYKSYADTSKGSPSTLTAPVETGAAEVRYVSGQGRKVLARRGIMIIAAEVSLSAPAEAVAGTTIDVAWTGPNNAGDYITVVPVGTPDDQYDNYTDTSDGSPMKLIMPIAPGNAELRYVTGQDHRVLARRPIRIVAAKITLTAPPECEPGAEVTITWTGPNNAGDYITIVPKGAPDDRYEDYANTTAGSPVRVKAPTQAGDAEIRYVSGQGNKVLARTALKVGP